jgi:hypothetical protein
VSFYVRRREVTPARNLLDVRATHNRQLNIPAERAMPTHPTTGRARSRDRLILIILVIVGAVSAVALLALVAGDLWLMSERVEEANRRAAAVDRATVAQQGADWTLNELFSYLQAKGAVSSMVVVESGADAQPAEWMFKTADNRTVRVRRWGDAATAANDARGSQKPGFSWGRFSFVGDPEANDRFRQFLHK